MSSIPVRSSVPVPAGPASSGHSSSAKAAACGPGEAERERAAFGCCPLAAVYALDTGDTTIDVECATDWACGTSGQDYFVGFFRAIDEGEVCDPGCWKSVRGREGYEDGLAVARAIIEAGMTEAVG